MTIRNCKKSPYFRQLSLIDLEKTFLVHDLTHDQGNIATFRTHITFEFQRTHIEFAWRSTFTYMFLLLAQISNFILMLYFSQITFSHEKLRNFLPFYQIFGVFNENFSLSH